VLVNIVSKFTNRNYTDRALVKDRLIEV
jgi:hypothetical protein